jgi:hypothetical protein
VNIALFAPLWSPRGASNGIVTYANHLLPALRGLGHQICVITPYRVDDKYPYTVDLNEQSARSVSSDGSFS